MLLLCFDAEMHRSSKG